MEGNRPAMSFASDKPHVAVFDLDGTLTRRDTYLWFLLRSFSRRPLRLFWLIPLAALVVCHRMGKLSNSQLKEAFLARILGGLSKAELSSMGAAFSRVVLKKGMRAGAYEQIEAHRKAGHRLLLATASLDIYVAHIARELRFEGFAATKCAWTADDVLSGKLDGPNLRGEMKLAAVRASLGSDWGSSVVVAYSDHESDIPLLAAARIGVAVNPTARLRAQAGALGLKIVDWGNCAPQIPT